MTDNIICKLCESGTEEFYQGKLYKPCECDTYVHSECLLSYRKVRYANSKYSNKCITCKSKYSIEMTKTNIPEPIAEKINTVTLFFDTVMTFFDIMKILFLIFCYIGSILIICFIIIPSILPALAENTQIIIVGCFLIVCHRICTRYII